MREKGDQRCQAKEAAHTAGDLLVLATARQQGRGAVARWKGIAARFAAHDDCFDQGDKRPAAAEPLFDRMLNSRSGQPQGRHHGSRRLPTALTIHERCQQQEQQPAGASRQAHA
jgi:hypothetical protein